MAWLGNNIPTGVNEKSLDSTGDSDLFEELESAAVALGMKEPGAMDAWNAVVVDLKDVIESLQRENHQLRQALAQRGLSGVANVNMN